MPKSDGGSPDQDPLLDRAAEALLDIMRRVLRKRAAAKAKEASGANE